MTAVGRMSVSALAGSSNISDRRRIEQAIENHIQLIQQADSLLTYDNVPATHRNGETGVTRACRKPAEYLARALNQKGLISNDDWRSNSAEANIQLFPSFPDPGRDLNDVILNEAIKETVYSYDEDKAIVTITYTFEAPEANVGLEKRILELSPNFQSASTPSFRTVCSKQCHADLNRAVEVVCSRVRTTSNGTPTPAHATAGAVLATHWRAARSHERRSSTGSMLTASSVRCVVRIRDAALLHPSLGHAVVRDAYGGVCESGRAWECA